MADGKGKPFLEVLFSTIHEDYRFPLLEIFAFMFMLGTFALSNFSSALSSQTLSGSAIAYQLTTALFNLPLLVFVFLILKNIAYGLGNDLEKGIVQTYFSYPIKRTQILTAKLLSALGVAVGLFIFFQLFALYILAPDIVMPNMGVILLTYVAGLSYPLLIAGVLLLMTLFVRRGGITLVAGIIIYFGLSIASSIVSFSAYATKSVALLQAFSFVSPQTVLGAYYAPSFMTQDFWKPAFSEVAYSMIGCYAIIAIFFAASYYYFSRRLSL